jgi:hypothetical protein
MAEVRIIPRDVNGIPLGFGLEIKLDTDALSPGFLCGPMIDQGNGSYLQRVASALPGTADVWISVEGVPLSDKPILTFEDTGVAGDLRELAGQYLDDMTAAGGTFKAALAGIDPKDPGASKIQEAWAEASSGLDALSQDNYDLDNDVVDNYIKSAIGELLAALGTPGEVDPEAILGLIDDLLDIGRLLAQFHLNNALDICGPCDPAVGGELCDAEQALANGDAERASADPDYELATSLYGVTIDKALDACIAYAGQ